MSLRYVTKLPKPDEIAAMIPVTESIKKLKKERDSEIKKIFTGESDKFILIIGPCSADNEKAVLDYMSRLSKLQDKVSDKIFMIPRIYTNKPSSKLKK